MPNPFSAARWRKKQSTARQLERWVGLEPLEPRVMLSATGSPPFAAPAFTPLPAEPHLLIAGSSQTNILHLNSDPYADIILQWSNGDGTDTLSAQLGQADGTFQRHDIATFPGTIRDAEIVDLRSNGHSSDIVVDWTPTDSSSGDNIDIYLDNGDGTFTHTGPTIATGVTDPTLTVMDMNGDNHPDLILNESTAVDVYLGDGTGAFDSAAHTDFAGDQIADLSHDVNGDGIDDAILNYTDFSSDSDNSIIEVHLGQPNGTYAADASFTSDTSLSTHFDRFETLAGDTLPDMLAYQEPAFGNTPATFLVYHNEGEGAFSQSFSLDLPNGYLHTATADVNDDGKPDLVVFEGNFDSGTSVSAHVLIAGNNATFTPGQTLTINNVDPNDLMDETDPTDSPITLQDINGDHSLDLVVNTVTNDEDTTLGMDFYFNNGQGVFATTPLSVIPTIANPEAGSIGQIQGDGKADVFFFGSDSSSSFLDNSVSIFVNHGNGTFGPEQTTDFGPNTEAEGFGNVETRSLTDLIVYQNVTTGTSDAPTAPMADSFKTYKTNADGSLQLFSGAVTFGGEVSPFNLIADIDGDTVPDLLVAGTSPAGAYAVIQGNSTTQQPPNIEGSFDAIKLGSAALSPSDVLVPGDKLTATVGVFDESTATPLTASDLTINLYASTDGTLGDAIPLQTFDVKNVKIAANHSNDYTISFQLPTDIAAGSYFLLAKIDATPTPSGNVLETVATSAFAATVALEAGQVGTRNNVTLNFNTPDGTPVTLALGGGGTATANLVGDTLNLQLTNTTAKSSFTLKSKAAPDGNNLVTLGSVTIGTPLENQSFTPAALGAASAAATTAASGASGGVSLKSFSAANGVLVGQFEINGLIQSIQIGEVAGGSIVIDPPPPGVKIAPLTLSIPISITNGSITSAIPIKSLTTVAWLDTDDTPDVLTAPTLGTLSVTGNKKASVSGDFEADLTLTDPGSAKIPTLSSAKIAGAVLGSTWNIAGSAGTIQATGGFGGNAMPVSITAAAIKSLTANDNVQNLTLNLTQAFNAAQSKLQDLGKLTITDFVNGLVLTSAGSIGSITTGDMSNSSILIGLTNPAAGLPATAGDFATASGTPGPSLSAITVKNNFVASNIAAPQIGTVTLPPPTTNPDAPAFGVAAEAIKSGKVGTTKLVDADRSGSVDPFNIDNFVVRIV